VKGILALRIVKEQLHAPYWRIRACVLTCVFEAHDGLIGYQMVNIQQPEVEAGASLSLLHFLWVDRNRATLFNSHGSAIVKLHVMLPNYHFVDSALSSNK
jgi:hypothetical protein